MNHEIKAIIEEIMKSIQEKKNILNDKTFDEEDNGTFSSESVNKLIDHMNITLQKISHTLTKITIMLSERPLPSNKDMIPLYTDLSNQSSEFYNFYTGLYTFNCGSLIKQKYKKSCIDILESIIEILTEIMNDVYGKEHEKVDDKNVLVANGCMWDSCKQFKELPKNMLEFCIQTLQTEFDTLFDAENELKNEIKQHEESDFHLHDSSWSDDDLKILPPATGLIKTSHSLCKKIKECIQRSGMIETKEHINQYTQCVEFVKKLSPGVDDLVTSLYPPIVKKQVNDMTKSLTVEILSILSFVKSLHCKCDSDNKWIEFLGNAAEHNSKKLLLTLNAIKENNQV